jgi:ferredoxin-NADP reductase
VGPFGFLTLRQNAARPAVFLAGGIGITPFRRMLWQAAERKLLHLSLGDAGVNSNDVRAEEFADY